MRLCLTFLKRVLALIPALLSCVALRCGAAVQAQSLRLQLLAQTLTASIHLEELPDGTRRMLVVQQDGRVLVMAPDGKTLPEPFLDFVAACSPWPMTLKSAACWVSLCIRNMPAMGAFLSVTRHPRETFGKILRIDVDRGFPGYAIPNGNPMTAPQGRPEIWAWGFRNPYRMAFDRNGSGDLFVTAIAETLWEAAYRVRSPGNFAWPLMEGSHCVDRLAPRKPPTQCPRQTLAGEPLQMPVVEYANMQVNHPDSTLGVKGVGTALTGVRMYRGAGIPTLQGKLVIADWSASFRQASGQLFVATPHTGGDTLWPMEKAAQLESRIISLAEARSGEIYVLTHEGMGPFGNAGKVHQLVSAP